MHAVKQNDRDYKSHTSNDDSGPEAFGSLCSWPIASDSIDSLLKSKKEAIFGHASFPSKQHTMNDNFN